MSNSDSIHYNLSGIVECARNFRRPLAIIVKESQKGVVSVDDMQHAMEVAQYASVNLHALLSGIHPEWLGNAQFNQVHACQYPYIVGEMANGIATADMVLAAVNAGFVGFFGAAGLPTPLVEKNIVYIKSKLGDGQENWGSNLIHSPDNLEAEERAVAIYLNHGVKRVSASAYMALSPQVVHYASKGLYLDEQQRIRRKNYVLAKISRPEVAKQFMRPAPQDILKELVTSGKITPEEANLAQHIPVSEDITVEADSGGHTDNRPLSVLFPEIQLLAHTICNELDYPVNFRIGCGGGIGTPAAAAAAFAMGASYILTGSINQSAVEAGVSNEAKMMLSKADMSDVAMAPAADMFELGVKLQVLKRGTLFSGRAKKLYEIYTKYHSISDIPKSLKEQIERQIFLKSLEDIWEETKSFFLEINPKQITLAEQDEHFKMALIFRWYLGLASRWAIKGEPSRVMDYQLWCGPAMGGFNSWVSGTFLEQLEYRTVAQIGKNILEGAAFYTRLHQLNSLGFAIPIHAYYYQPIPFPFSFDR